MAAELVCQVIGKPDKVTFIWSDGPASFPPYDLTGNGVKKFRDLARQAREQLSDLVKDYLHGADEDVRRSSHALAQVGHKLYQQVFRPAAEQRDLAEKVGRWLAEMRDHDAIGSLEFVMDGLEPVPWNVVYEREPDEAAFLAGAKGTDCWLPFWGVRYNLAGGRRVEPLRRLPWLDSSGLKLLMVVDPEIRRGLPEVQRRRLEEFLRGRSLTAIESRDQLTAALEDGRPDLMYWLCHATPEALVLGGEPISPADLTEMLQEATGNRFGGLAFLNACQTAEEGEVGSFLNALHEEGFSGIVATEHQTVDTFAHPFGLDFLEAFLDTGEPIGRLLQRLRGRGVPLGLLYGTYCPPGIYVRRPADAASGPAVIAEASRLAGVALGGTAAPVAPKKRLTPLPEEPYRSLAFYDREHRALFVGRDDDAERFALILDDSKTRILVLHGESGVGKSSFLRAGAIPYLEEECVGYRFLRDRTGAEYEPPSLFIRATNDPAGQLAQALCSYCARPVSHRAPDGQPVEVDLPGILADALGSSADPATLREALRAHPALLGRLLSDLAGRLPHNLVLIIDQVEEIFTLARTSEDAESRRLVLEMLRLAIPAQGDFKLILALRTEFYGRLVDGLRRGLRNLGGVREYLLTDFDEADLIEAIRRPTSTGPIPHSSEIPFEKYQFRYDQGVPETVAQGVLGLRSTRQDSVLPLVQVICTQLHERVLARDDRTIGEADLLAIGGVRGGMRRHVESLLDRLLSGGLTSDRTAVRRLFTKLYLRQSDGTLSTALVTEDELARRWTGRMSFGEIVALASAGQTRLLRVNTLWIGDVEERRYVSLGHDALAKVAADWDEELSRGVRVRKLVALLVGVSAVAAAMLVLAMIARGSANKAEASRQLADERRREFQMISANLALDRGQSLGEQGDVDHCILWLARSLEIAPPDAMDLRRVIRANLAAWQTQLRRLDMILQHGNGVRAVAFSPDGRMILTGSFDKTARQWDAATGVPTTEPLTHSESVGAVAYRPDGKVFATGSRDGFARLWDSVTGHPVGKPIQHEDSVTAVVFSSNNKFCVTGSQDKSVCLWDAATGDPLGVSMKQEDHVSALALSPDCATLLIACNDKTARLWDVASRRPLDVPVLRHSDLIRSVAFSPDGQTFITGGQEAAVRLWDRFTGVLIREYAHPRGGIASVAFSPDGRFLLTGHLDGTARLWDVTTARIIGTPIKHQDWIPAVAFSPDGTRLLTGSGDKTARLWEFRSVNTGPVFEHKGWVRSVAFSPDGQTVLTGGDNKSARLWDAVSGAIRGDPLKHADWVSAVVFSSDGKLALTGSGDTTGRIWEVTTTQPVGQPLRHGGRINCVAFSPDGKLALTGGSNRMVRLWDVTTSQPVGDPLIFQDMVFAADFHPDGRCIATGSYDGIAQLWDAVTHRPLGLPMRHPNSVSTVAFSPDGKSLATGCDDGSARRWDIATSRALGGPLQHPSSVWSVAFSPDGESLLTGDQNGFARLWDLRTGKPIGIPLRHRDTINSVAFRRDGRAILTGSWDRTARIWPVPPPPAEDDIHRIAFWTGSLTGLELESGGTYRVLSTDEWKRSRADLAARGGPPLPRLAPGKHNERE